MVETSIQSSYFPMTISVLSVVILALLLILTYAIRKVMSLLTLLDKTVSSMTSMSSQVMALKAPTQPLAGALLQHNQRTNPIPYKDLSAKLATPKKNIAPQGAVTVTQTTP